MTGLDAAIREATQLLESLGAAGEARVLLLGELRGLYRAKTLLEVETVITGSPRMAVSAPDSAGPPPEEADAPKKPRRAAVYAPPLPEKKAEVLTAWQGGTRSFKGLMQACRLSPKHLSMLLTELRDEGAIEPDAGRVAAPAEGKPDVAPNPEPPPTSRAEAMARVGQMRHGE